MTFGFPASVGSPSVLKYQAISREGIPVFVIDRDPYDAYTSVRLSTGSPTVKFHPGDTYKFALPYKQLLVAL